jgi:hypothetical protein
MDMENDLSAACRFWQGGRNGGSTPVRAAARMLTGRKHYFEADFIAEVDRDVQRNEAALSAAGVLLGSLNKATHRTAAEWCSDTGLPPSSFAGRGLEPKGPFIDDQIKAALRSGFVDMPLWGVSLDREIALSYGSGKKHLPPAFMFEIAGAFPAVPAWSNSDHLPEEQELVCGGRYRVIDTVTDDNGTVTARFEYVQPIRALSTHPAR